VAVCGVVIYRTMNLDIAYYAVSHLLLNG